MSEEKKHLPGWYWFCPCGQKPKRVEVGMIPVFPYKHFDTFEECEAAIAKSKKATFTK